MRRIVAGGEPQEQAGVGAYAGNRAASFEEASDALLELAEVSISTERVRRACGHVGQDLIDEQRQLQAAYQAKPLLEQATGKPADATAPEIACVMVDGGRYQQLDRPRGEKKCGDKKRDASSCRSARKGKHWKESRIALLSTTVKQVSRRVKGSEKFWSSPGGEEMLRLRGPR